MAGLDESGFVPLSYDEIRTRIQGRLEQYNPGFDFTPSSPDGQLVDIFSFELSQAWQQLDLVYRSYDPAQATGAGLRNMGLITGIPFEAASRSFATVETIGVDGATVPKGTIFTSDDGEKFSTLSAVDIPGSVSVYATKAGPVPVPAGTITGIQVPVQGLTGVNQFNDGTMGGVPISEAAFRNVRNRTVQRNFADTPSTISAKLFELGVPQVEIISNNTNSDYTTTDATPARSIQVVVGEIGDDISDEDIAKVILAKKSLGVPTFGSTTVSVSDSQGHFHDISFSKATEVHVFVRLHVVFLSADFAGAIEGIQEDIAYYINGLLAGEDVIRSRLYGLATAYAQADVTSLELSTDGTNWVEANIAIAPDEYATTTELNIPIINDTP